MKKDFYKNNSKYIEPRFYSKEAPGLFINELSDTNTGIELKKMEINSISKNLLYLSSLNNLNVNFKISNQNQLFGLTEKVSDEAKNIFVNIHIKCFKKNGLPLFGRVLPGKRFIGYVVHKGMI